MCLWWQRKKDVVGSSAVHGISTLTIKGNRVKCRVDFMESCLKPNAIWLNPTSGIYLFVGWFPWDVVLVLYMKQWVAAVFLIFP